MGYNYNSKFRNNRELDNLANSVIYNKVCKMIAEQFDVEAERLDGNISIINDLGADSLDIINLMISIEEEFEVVAPDDDTLENLQTIRELSLYIERAEHKE